MSFYADDILETAYAWLCRRREDYSCHADIWQLRSNWATEKIKLLDALQQEDYQFDAVQLYHLPDKTIGIWSAKDALVLKMLAIYLRKQLDPILSPRIFHLAGLDGPKRGTKAAVAEVYKALPKHQFVFRTDVKSYYASIQHQVLFQLEFHLATSLRVLDRRVHVYLIHCSTHLVRPPVA